MLILYYINLKNYFNKKINLKFKIYLDLFTENSTYVILGNYLITFPNVFIPSIVIFKFLFVNKNLKIII